jgi:amidophosphoribosyltransferase
MLREAGAVEVHVRISSPPVKWPCFYGIDFASRAELIANGLDVDGVRASINADSLGYVSEQGLVAATEQPATRLCTACFTGQYPIPLGESELLGKHVLEAAAREQRSVSGWTGRQAGSATVPGGAEDALSRP